MLVLLLIFFGFTPCLNSLCACRYMYPYFIFFFMYSVVYKTPFGSNGFVYIVTDSDILEYNVRIP